MSTLRYCQQENVELALPRLIYYTSQDLQHLAGKILAPYDLTLEQFHPLKILSLAPGLSQRQIGDECNKSAANLTRILDRLQKKSLIERRDNPDDRRSSLVYLTTQGQALVTEVTGILDSFTEKIIAGISAQEQQVLRQALEQMTTNIQQLNLEYQTK